MPAFILFFLKAENIHLGFLCKPPNWMRLSGFQSVTTTPALQTCLLMHPHIDVASFSQPLAWFILFSKGLMNSHNAANTEDGDVRIPNIHRTLKTKKKERKKNRTSLQAVIWQAKYILYESLPFPAFVPNPWVWVWRAERLLHSPNTGSNGPCICHNIFSQLHPYTSWRVWVRIMKSTRKLSMITSCNDCSGKHNSVSNKCWVQSYQQLKTQYLQFEGIWTQIPKGTVWYCCFRPFKSKMLFHGPCSLSTCQSRPSMMNLPA